MNHIIWCTFFQKRHFSEFDYFIKNLFTVKKTTHERFNFLQKFHEIQQVTCTLQVGKLWLFQISLVHSKLQKRVLNRFVLCSLVTQGSGLNKVKKNKKKLKEKIRGLTIGTFTTPSSSELGIGLETKWGSEGEYPSTRQTHFLPLEISVW